MIDRFDFVRVAILLLAFMALISPPLAHAQTLVWDPPFQGVVDGYIIYWGTDRDDPFYNTDVGSTLSFPLDELELVMEEGFTYYISVSAYNSVSESPRCTPVTFTPVDQAGNESGYSSETNDSAESSTSSGNSGSSQTTIAMWWTYFDNRSTAVPVKIYDGSTLLDTVTVNQKENGGQWNTLGAYSFQDAPKIVVVAKAAAGTTCADAVKITAPEGTTTIIDNGQNGTSSSGTWKTSGGLEPYGANSIYCKDGSYTFVTQ